MVCAPITTNASGLKTLYPERMSTEPEALQTVRSYHQRTKHRFEAYAPGPGTLDWDAQPAPFRHFDGANSIPLISLADVAKKPALAAALQRPFSSLAQPSISVPLDIDALSVLLQLALGITAWKTYGPDRWAVRANPSSGNLHPIEGYLLLRAIPGLADGLYHYSPDTHALECRAEFAPADGPPQVFVALSSVMWREAWKYGERAFRYCQLDTGHAVGALRYASALLGWPQSELRQVETVTLSRWLGLDRTTEFSAGRTADTEREEAEILLSLTPEPDLEWLQQAGESARWHGTASAIDRHPMYQWPVIAEVAEATRHLPLTGETSASHHRVDIPADLNHTLGHNPSQHMGAATLILHRRSAQRFDARHIMPLADFCALLAATLPQPRVPWDTLASSPSIALVLFVHRVEHLQPGIYLLPRTADLAELLNANLDKRFLRQPVEGTPLALGLELLSPAPAAELHRVARSLNCHQDIAANACFSLGMLARFDDSLSTDSSAYRDLYREAGLIGQVLYLNAEAQGLRGTGIGCYFDDPFHELLGLKNQQLQSLYHFTVGLALEDTRIETTISEDLRLTS